MVTGNSWNLVPADFASTGSRLSVGQDAARGVRHPELAPSRGYLTGHVGAQAIFAFAHRWLLRIEPVPTRSPFPCTLLRRQFSSSSANAVRAMPFACDSSHQSAHHA